MTQPPDERDPTAGGPSPTPESAAPGPPTTTPSTPPAPPGDAPTQSWSATPPAADVAPGPASPAAPLAAGPIISADPGLAPGPAAPAAGPAVAWSVPALAKDIGAPGLTWADTPSRVVAYILDSFLVAITAGIVVAVLGIGGTAGTASTQASQAISVVTTVIGAAYFIASWSGGRRATPAQRLFNIQIGNAFDGRPLTTTQAAKRWLGLGTFLGVFGLLPSDSIFRLINLIQLVWVLALVISAATSPTKQGLHDRFANSAVVRPIGASTGLAVACLILVIGLLVFAILSIVALIFLGGQVSAILSDIGNSV